MNLAVANQYYTHWKLLQNWLYSLTNMLIYKQTKSFFKKRTWILINKSGLTGFHDSSKWKASKIFWSSTYTHLISPSRMWEPAKTGSRDAELTGVKCWKHKHEQIPIYQSLAFLSCTVLVADIFPPLDMSFCTTTSAAESKFGREIWIVKMKAWRREIIILSLPLCSDSSPCAEYNLWHLNLGLNMWAGNGNILNCFIQFQFFIIV